MGFPSFRTARAAASWPGGRPRPKSANARRERPEVEVLLFQILGHAERQDDDVGRARVDAKAPCAIVPLKPKELTRPLDPNASVASLARSRFAPLFETNEATWAFRSRNWPFGGAARDRYVDTTQAPPPAAAPASR